MNRKPENNPMSSLETVIGDSAYSATNRKIYLRCPYLLCFSLGMCSVFQYSDIRNSYAERRMLIDNGQI